MSGYTKGPWKRVDTADYAQIHPVAQTQYGEAIALVQKPEDADLIAAAPELLEALTDLLDYSGGADHALADPYVVERARAALAKARGAAS